MSALKNRNSLFLAACWLGMFLLMYLPQSGFSQLKDGSFELQPGSSPTVYGWTACQGDPDLQVRDGSGPGIFGINTPPAHGQRYLGLVATQQGLGEAVGQSYKLKAGELYYGSIALFRSMAHQSWNGTGQIQIWGGTSCSNPQELLWTSGNITNLDNWRTVDIAFTPMQNYDWLTIQVALEPGSGEMTYVCMDNLYLENEFFPVHFVSLEAHAQSTDVLLQWETAALENDLHFEVEWSADGQEFAKVGTVDAMAFQSRFEYRHGEPRQGRQFYRIRSVDQDGSEILSEVRQVVWAGTGVQVFPNPVAVEGGRIQVSAGGNIQNLRLLDMEGKTMMEIKGEDSGGMDLELPVLAQGCYLLQVQVDGKQSMHRLMVR